MCTYAQTHSAFSSDTHSRLQWQWPACPFCLANVDKSQIKKEKVHRQSNPHKLTLTPRCGLELSQRNCIFNLYPFYSEGNTKQTFSAHSLLLFQGKQCLPPLARCQTGKMSQSKVREFTKVSSANVRWYSADMICSIPDFIQLTFHTLVGNNCSN